MVVLLNLMGVPYLAGVTRGRLWKSIFQIRYLLCVLFIFWIVCSIAEVLLGRQNFQQINSKTTNKNNNYLLLWYAPPSWAPDMKLLNGLKDCVFKNCDISIDKKLIDKSDVLLFHHSEMLNKTPIRNENQIWIFMTLESPVHIYGPHSEQQWDNAFNWTWSYRQDSEIFTPYAKLSKRIVPKEKNYRKIFQQKSKDVAWLVSNCYTHSERSEYVRKMQKYINVDIFGDCGEPCEVLGDDCVKDISNTYKFYLSFENSICEDYITEKAFKLYKGDYDIVPVIRGAPNIKDILPKGTFISTSDFKSPKTLALYLWNIGQNETKYSNYIKAKDRYITTSYNDWIEDGTCLLCETLNRQQEIYGTVNLSQWILTKKCFSPTDF
ncbi:4-galactosyl-N-acetylglucosaminide 3-alpha-L-fucosyltransferase 9-like [Mytilus galloprovincialis]|uniref:4-galactosyl-N-acetylglucosaminide 3-alpha-L-fucosyltransferase 9-like n=1 Tax=Mytilus galloprovincialis TaxID=29158 RepID=UPI003F7C2117